MIFAVLNPEKNLHQQLVHLPTSPVYCSHFTLENPKKSFSIVLFILQIIYVISEENKLLLPYPPHLKNVTALPCIMLKCFIFFYLFHVYRVPICDTDELRKRFVATWAEFQQSMADDTVDQWRKRLEACIRAECGHFEHLTEGMLQSSKRWWL